MNKRISETTDYSKFEMLPFNRPVTKTAALEKSMQKHGWIDAYPLHCVKNGNGTYKVKAGHHRLHVAKKLGIAVKFVVCDDNASIHALESGTVSWSISDFLVSYVREGRPPYMTVDQYHRRTGIPLAACISMLAGESAGSNNKNRSFKRGDYQLGDPWHAETVADIVLHLKKRCKLKWATHAFLVQAISRSVWVDEFDPERFKQKAARHRHMIEKQPNLEEYLDMIEAIYNRQSREKIPLVFLVKQKALQRQRRL